MAFRTSSTKFRRQHQLTFLLGQRLRGFHSSFSWRHHRGRHPDLLPWRWGISTGTAFRTSPSPTESSNNITILLGNGWAGLDARAAATLVRWAARMSLPVFLVVRDFNGDGIEDLADCKFRQQQRNGAAGCGGRRHSADDYFCASQQRGLREVSPYTIGAMASSGLPVSFASTTPAVCTVSGSTVTILGGGTCSLVASQPGNATYAAAPTVLRSQVNPGPQTNTVSRSRQCKPQHPAAFTPSATASSGLTVTFTSSTPTVCIASGNLRLADFPRHVYDHGEPDGERQLRGCADGDAELHRYRRTAQPVIIYSNFAPNLTFGNSAWGVSSGQVLSQPFTPAANFTFTSAKVAVFASANIVLQADSSGLPGAVIEQVLTPAASAGDIQTFSSALHPLLHGGTQYWLTLLPGAVGVSTGWYWNSTGALGYPTHKAAVLRDRGTTLIPPEHKGRWKSTVYPPPALPRRP